MILYGILAIAIGLALLWNSLRGTSGPKPRNRIDKSLYTGREDQEWVDR
jgi:hypothetical protein